MPDAVHSADALIDRFVNQVNCSPRLRIREEDVPLPLREGGARAGLYYSWTIRRAPKISWIAPLERRLPAPLPPAYRSLVTRYVFPAFELGPLLLLANTGQPLYHEMAITMARDRILSPILVKARFAQFARPIGDYDPICFDYNRRTPEGSCPIVRLDYEDLLSRARATVTEQIAPSFRWLVEEYLAAGTAAVGR